MPGFFWTGRNHLVPTFASWGHCKGECGRVIPALTIDNTIIPWLPSPYDQMGLTPTGNSKRMELKRATVWEYEQPVHCERLWCTVIRWSGSIWKPWPRGELCTESSPPLKISEDKEATVLACQGCWIQIWTPLIIFEHQGNNPGKVQTNTYTPPQGATEITTYQIT